MREEQAMEEIRKLLRNAAPPKQQEQDGAGAPDAPEADETTWVIDRIQQSFVSRDA